MSDYITSDVFLQARALELYNRLISHGRAHLFTNNFTPTPASNYANFVEANFAGYSWVSLTPFLYLPRQVVPGLWQIDCDEISITSVGAPVNIIYGIYVDDGTSVVYSRMFPGGITVTTGISITFAIAPQVSGT